MSNISQTGDYRGLVIDRGLSNSSGGYLQLEVTLQATEKYDSENGVWTPYDFEDCEAQAYLNLVTSKEIGNPVNLRQIMRAFGWDGLSFSTLNNPDTPLAKQIQWHMSAETYNEIERIKVTAIGAYDAAPGRAVEKLDVAAARAVDSKYAAILQKLSGGPKPKSARPTAPPQAPAVVPTPDPTPAPTPTAESVAAPVTSVAPAPTEKPKRGRKPSVPATLPPTVSAPPAAQVVPVPVQAMTQEEAWVAYDNRTKGKKTDLEITNTWTAVVKEKYDSDDAVGDKWADVYAECCARLGV